MDEKWKKIKGFSDYSVSNYGRIRSEKSGRILALSENQFGVVCVGMMKDGVQCHRSVPLLVAKAFIPHPSEVFDTPINLNGNRDDNQVGNLVWRPRWFAIKYNHQFKEPFEYPIHDKIQNLKTGEIFDNSMEASMYYGLLEQDLVLSILNRTYCWPIYQEFSVIE
jgi:hypothetical protein